ncbi:hypothetical protein B0H14DRAFT_2612293 [Mycena olivaceomarginata]|nr:hypothetical protein B0H14DRAFT_2612293 [Mycena olivaceomarginata]
MATGTAGENEKPRILSTSSRKLATVNLHLACLQKGWAAAPTQFLEPLKLKIDILTSGSMPCWALAGLSSSAPRRHLSPKSTFRPQGAPPRLRTALGARSAIIVGANAISGRLKPKVDFLTSGGRGTVIVGLNVISGSTLAQNRHFDLRCSRDVPLMLPTTLGARGTVIVGANAISGPLKPKIDVLTSGWYPDAPLRARCSRDHHRPPQCDFRGVPPRLCTALGARSTIIVSANAISGATLAQNRHFDLRVFL